MRHIKIILLIVFLTFTCSMLQSQPPPPPNHGSSGNEAPEGVGAPIGGGALILSLLAAGYGIVRWYGKRGEEKE